MKTLLTAFLFAGVALSQSGTTTPSTTEKPKQEAKMGCCGSVAACCASMNDKKDQKAGEPKKGGCCGSQEGSMCKREPMKDKSSTDTTKKKQ